MSEKKIYLAVDLGAGSGRVLAGEFDGQRIELHELNRFENKPIELPDGWHWNITDLYQNILDGLKAAAKKYRNRPISVGIDTWGVDYGLLDADGRLIGTPYQYRDNRTDGMMASAFEKVSKKEIYEATGIQFMFFNSIFQLLSEVEKRNPAINIAEDLLFIPDLLGYWLTGQKTQERSIVSTTQLYNPTKKDWDYSLIERLNLPKQLFKKISDASDSLGQLRTSVQDYTGLKKLKVVTVGGHDTASAVAAVPSQAKTPAFLSSGTWSLMGLELAEPIISEQSFADAFTNEIGVNGTVRFLKNICGLWLIQESRRYWLNNGHDYGYAEMAGLAEKVTPFRSLINPDAPCFAEAGRMPEKIQAFCRETKQQVPETPGEVIRCIYESLALRYAEIWSKLSHYAHETPDCLHIVGGGCQDKLLNQFTACAIGATVKAGPVEATGLGNIMAQMLADGTINTLNEGRTIVDQSFPTQIYQPEDSAAWDGAKERFAAL
ncbi:rhamnulokinase [Coraliomargarita sp. SDUM461004]|uniref:Rhamnulokinase n=1 Tax=Thalassobacterium sedimentorum TaxID=3041258 RepID=A0ABU1ALT6_9BACT|nr:rhamnulokinase family protein [Coraliomargarita sp. SDUM461004]MDQ8194558.1 rhamnulokinase [Coraliomargarita sp. SDUM461004]